MLELSGISSPGRFLHMKRDPLKVKTPFKDLMEFFYGFFGDFNLAASKQCLLRILLVGKLSQTGNQYLVTFSCFFLFFRLLLMIFYAPNWSQCQSFMTTQHNHVINILDIHFLCVFFMNYLMVFSWTSPSCWVLLVSCRSTLVAACEKRSIVLFATNTFKETKIIRQAHSDCVNCVK